ncbi:MAG: hypothetical protein V4697_02395 [Patescibacteria group bacterium]
MKKDKIEDFILYFLMTDIAVLFLSAAAIDIKIAIWLYWTQNPPPLGWLEMISIVSGLILLVAVIIQLSSNPKRYS